MTGLLIIELKTISLMMFDLTTVDSMSIKLMTSLTKKSIELLIESFVELKKIAVD